MHDTPKVIDAHKLAGGSQRDAMLMCYAACKLDGHALGWMPKMAYDQALDAGRIITVWRNADLVGFIVFGIRLRELKIFQTWVRKDARMIENGRALVHDLKKKATATQCVRLSLWCADDLPANQFWQRLGFTTKSWRWSPHRVRRRHNFWSMRLSNRLFHCQPLARSDEQPWPLPGSATLRLTD